MCISHARHMPITVCGQHILTHGKNLSNEEKGDKFTSIGMAPSGTYIVA